MEASERSALRGRFRLDLGLSRLVPEWRRMFSRRDLGADVLSGITVGLVAIPLSLAIAVASDVPAGLGLISAIVGGVICGLTGGTPLAISGPAAAMAVLVGTVVDRHGISGLLFVGLGCGLLQVLTGVVGLGKLVRFVPVPVIAGFTAGIGAIILIGQLPRGLGLPPPDESHVFDVIRHIGKYLHDTNLAALALTLGSLVICLVMPRLSRRVPGPLLAVIVATGVSLLFGLDVPQVGEVPRTLPMPQLPSLPTGDLGSLVSATVLVFALASLETLLSSTATDKLARGPRHDPDQELIGQGLGNVTTALFGGIPVTAVIARSALNVQSGGRTRRAAIVHSAVVFILVFAFAPLMARIPMAALAGVLFSVALRMLNVSEFRLLWHVSRSDAGVYLATFVVIVLGDLIAGVQVGLALAFLIAGIRLGHARVRLHHDEAFSRLRVRGPITFLATRSLDPIRDALDTPFIENALAIDLGEVTSLDSSGAEMLVTLVEELEASGTRVAVIGLPVALEQTLLRSDVKGHLPARLARGDEELHQILDVGPPGAPPIERLKRGVRRFRDDMSSRYQRLFEHLARGQAPHTLFITCSDSRIIPSLLTSTDPGEMLIVRNIGNIVPAATTTDDTPAEGAAVEYALLVLGVKEIVVCGHSGCGAMGALVDRQGAVPGVELPRVGKWLEAAAPAVHARGDGGVDAVARANVLLQVDHLMSYPEVQQRVGSGALRVHGWFYDIATADLLAFNPEHHRFESIAPTDGPAAGASAESRPQVTPGGLTPEPS